MTTLLSRDYAHPSVWSFLSRHHAGRIGRRQLAGRRHEVARCALCRLLFHRYVLADPALAALYEDLADAPAAAAGSAPIELPPEGARVLDLGAGRGSYCRAARERGCEVTAVEIAPRHLESLRDARIEAFSRVDDVPHDDFAFVRCHEILEHLPRPLETLRALGERLAPGGRISLRVPDAERSSPRLPCRFWSAADDALRPLEHVNGFTPRSLRSIADQLGLELELRPVARRPLRRPTTLRAELAHPGPA